MDIFNVKKIAALEKQVQATEGAISNVLLESLLTGTPLNTAGAENIYTSYASQTTAIYKKYNGKDTLGNWQLRAVIDTRTSFIAGEGLSVICKDEKTSKFFDDFLSYNKLYGSRFINIIKQLEMEGKQLLYIKPNKEDKQVRLLRHLSNYCGGRDYEVKYKDINDPESIADIIIKKKDGTKEPLKDKFVYIVTGGDSSTCNEPTTRAGLVLWEIESYDRSKNAMRKNNHLFGKVTPVFNSDNPQDVANFRALAKSKDWVIGDIVAAMNGDFKMVTPDLGAMDNLKAEQVTCAKAVSATTGIPVHWFGNVDMMSNRATADSLYETINNATMLERSVMQEKIYDLLLMVQEMAIDNGFYKGTVNKDFEVKIPLVSFNKMKERIDALSLAYSDDAISIQDYRNMLPGINPYKTAQMVEEDQGSMLESLKLDNKDILNGKEDDSEEDN